MQAIYTAYDMQAALIVGAICGAICGAILNAAWNAWRGSR